jgi:hypothetical protein
MTGPPRAFLILIGVFASWAAFFVGHDAQVLLGAEWLMDLSSDVLDLLTRP